MKIVLVILITISSLFDLIVVMKNNKNQKEQKDSLFYQKNEYDKFTSYQTQKSKGKLLYIFTRQLFFAFLVIFLYSKIEIIGKSFFDNQYLITLFVVGIIYSIYQLISSIYEYYDTFIIETKFDFNKSTKKMFLKEQLIDFLITLFIVLFISSVLLLIYNNLNEKFVIIGYIIVAFLLILYNIYFVILFMPLMFKMTPIEDENLRNEIYNMESKENFNPKYINVLNASAKTTKYNAYFSGFGKNKRVMLFDNLLEKFSTREILAVIAHEVGHSKYNHMLKDLIKDLILTLFYFGMFYIILNNEYFELTSSSLKFVQSIVILMIMFEVLNKIIKIATNYISRKNEKEADLYTKKLGYGPEMSEILVKAAKQNLGNLYPHPVFVLTKFDHPPLLTRLDYLKKENK